MGIYISKYKVLFNDVSLDLKITDIALMKYLVEAAGEHSENVGYGLSNIKNTNIVFLLTNWKIKIFSRPSVLEDFSIKTWVESFSHSLSIRNFEVYLNNELSAKASSKWVLVNPETHSILPINKELINAYDPVDKKIFDEKISKILVPDNINLSYKYTVCRRDIDSNNHVNNLKYLELAYEILPQKVFENHNFDELSINYKNECKLSDMIICNYTQINKNEHTIVFKSHNSDKIHAIINLKR